MELTLRSKRKKVLHKVEQDHYWYDSESKQMLHERGGRMDFIYDPAQKKSFPVIVDHEEWIDGNNYDEIKKWIKNNSDKYGFSVESDNGTNVTISIDEKQIGDIQEDLYRNGITSD